MCNNHKFYIGYSKNLKRRLADHRVGKDYKGNCMRAYGYKVYILCDNLTLEEALYVESKLVDQKFIDREDTLNRILGGIFVPINGMSEINKQKHSERMRNRIPWNKGKKNTQKPNSGTFAKGGHCGEKHPRSKVSDKDREEMWALRKAGHKPPDIASRFNISRSQVFRNIRYIERLKNESN